jgi:hypothetical protein
MKRSLLVGLVILSSCNRIQPSLTWLEPTPGSVVVGTVELSVQTVGETPTFSNVVFYLGDDPIAKAYGEDGRFTATWESSTVAPGDHLLRAKPYNGPPVEAPVTVATRRPLD